MMIAFAGDYQDWEQIDYRPALATLQPTVLLEYVKSGDRALDIGCNTGGEALFLASHGLNVLGLDMNPVAIDTARTRAAQSGLASRTEFTVADFLDTQFTKDFELVLLIRVLTCIPQEDDWQTMLRFAWSSIQSGGLLYVRDFLLTPESPIYGERYAAGVRLGWREGNFLVSSQSGEPLFVAHHHSDEEVKFICAPYQCIVYTTGESLSMHGNACRMFEFVGRKVDPNYPPFDRPTLEDHSRTATRQPRKGATLQIAPSSMPKLAIRHFRRADAPLEMRVAAEKLEKQFSIEFENITHFSAATLASLQEESSDSAAAFSKYVTVASVSDPAVIPLVQTLTSVANAPTLSVQNRRVYWATLLAVYAKLPFQPATSKDDAETLFVGIQREGYLLAKAMDCMREGHSIAPHAKRIHFEKGLLVGFNGIPQLPHYPKCVVIDGAIASGSTMIALLEQLQSSVRSFHVCSVHGTGEGIRAILRYADLAGIEVKISVGHVTEGLDDHFYARLPKENGKLVVGDLGDTISELG